MWPAIIAAAGPVIGGIAGNLMGQRDKDAADDAMRRAMAQFDHLNIPDIEKQKLALESPEVQGILQPFMQQAEQMAPTAMEQISTDPRLKQAQMNALDTLSRMGSEGLTAEDKAALNQARRQTAGDEQARQGSILQQMAQRGIGGSGQELAARLQSSQGAADRASQESDRTMAMAQRRMLEATTGAGSLGGNIRQQDYGEQSDLARARDVINQFNTQQRSNVGASNIAALNRAQEGNLATKQRVYEAGVDTRNREQMGNKALLQQQFENEMRLRGARSGALQGQAQQHQSNAAQTQQQWANIGTGVGQIGAATMAKSDDNISKKDIKKQG